MNTRIRNFNDCTSKNELLATELLLIWTSNNLRRNL
jgi:hypothetical protein